MWIEVEKHKWHSSKSKIKKKTLLITEKQSCKNQFTIIALIYFTEFSLIQLTFLDLI